MFLNAAFTLLLLGILTSVLVTGQECGLRNTAAAGRSCERACGDGGTCRKGNRECVCDGLCGLSCLKKACPLLQSPVEGYVTVTPSQHYIDAVAQYRCNSDHTLVGNSNRTCQSDKTWSGSEPVCRELSDSAPVLADTHHCSFLAFPTNGVVAYYEERRIEGAIATYRCDDGYTLIGNKNRTCLRESSWSGSEPDCVVLYCSDMNIPDGNVHHGEVNRISREGDDITFSCKEGFQLRYPQRTCTGGRWTQALPYCEEVVRCPSVQNPLNGQKIGHDYLYDSEVAFRCNLGYILEGANEIRCLTSGSWSAAPPTCRGILTPVLVTANCQPVLDEEGREIVYFDDRSYVHGSNLTVSCDDDTVLIGSMTSRCDHGIWNPPVGKCLVNVAENKRAYQGSSAYTDSGADLAVNGLTVENGRCSQTQTTNQWWFVDLGANFAVREIQIYHHDDQNTLLNAEVRVGQEAGSETNQNTLVGRVTDVSSNPVRITLNGNVEGRFVSVDHTGSSVSLTLCEVQIFGDLLGDPCDNGCVVPRSLANGRYGAPIRSEINFRTIDPGSCFRDNIHLSVLCNPDNSLFGSHYYTCDQNTGKFDYRNTGHREMLSYCGSSCPRPQINLNVLYFVGENNDPIGDRTAFNQAEEIYSKCEDPRYQLHVGHNRRRCQRGLTWNHGVWTGSAPRCDISQLHMDISPKTSLTISPSGQFVLVTPMDEVTISCRNRFNGAQLSGDTRMRKDGEDTHGERSDDTSVFRLVIINPTAEDSGIYTCLSSGLSHSISVAFEETPVCSSPTTNPHVIALVGENNLPIASRVSFSEGERLAFLCEDDMTLVGANSIECIEGQWTGRTPTCEDNRCSRPYIFPNIIAHVGVGEDTTEIGNRQSFVGGETITFRCEDVRYQILDGPIHRQCIDGEWTERAPRCETSQLQVGVDNTILKTVSPDGTFIVYPIVGSIFINCELRTGFIRNSATITTDSTTQPSQRAYIAGKLKRLRLRDPTSGNDGTYTCESGSLRHSIRIKFQDIRCPAPGNVSNGRWAYRRATANTLNPHAYILNEKVTVQCNPGFHASNNQESWCNYQGQWSPPLSSCIAN